MAVFSKVLVYVAIGALVACAVYCFYKCYKYKAPALPAAKAFKLNIHVISSAEECEPLIYELRRRSMEYKSVGFDCEWVTHKGRREPVSLLQLATSDGFCVLIRLNRIKTPFPPSLTAFLEDPCIYKLGVAPLNDAKYLNQDHGLKIVSTVDLRCFAMLCNKNYEGGLAQMTKKLLNVVLDKNLKVRCSDWDADTLTCCQLHYAASDAYAAIRIFVKVIAKLDDPFSNEDYLIEVPIWQNIDSYFNKFADTNYKKKKSKKVQNKNNNDKAKEEKDPKGDKRYSHLKRSKPLYDNCFLQAPDGEVLSTIDGKKAKWYLDQGLADEIEKSPLTVRLRFEPAGRSDGEVGRYYTQVKENKCVVCGEEDTYIRKNVVPREYRKYFPEILKDHSSHDIVLLCGPCHRRSNILDQALREHLAAHCQAPLPTSGAGKHVEDKDCKKVRMAARALYNESLGKYTLPDVRRKALEAEVMDYYSERKVYITGGILKEAMKLSVMVKNENAPAESHGQAVVRHYVAEEEGGLLRLEELWRAHFLSAMQPEHMPALWSCTHTLDRLREKWQEGRLSGQQLDTIGYFKHFFA